MTLKIKLFPFRYMLKSQPSVKQTTKTKTKPTENKAAQIWNVSNWKKKMKTTMDKKLKVCFLLCFL